ncbi:hypothetical protein QAA18_02260 [Luteimonas sp. 8-5]|uniref:hypothetical protein n=1 Tax=Luteimonas sp. 8-5 TaxID=3039387 RepID=UPI0024372AB1|nr:hypothetical protein [Luteimonas sp. 8-5]MDG6347573.1 hypothetical protein [Luteimonas sp. 8-5]
MNKVGFVMVRLVLALVLTGCAYVAVAVAPASSVRLQVVVEPQAYTALERQWVETIRSRADRWRVEAEHLAAMYPPLEAPPARIVLASRGGEDAFVIDPNTIGFDVGRLQALYGGSSNEAQRAERMDRFFRHEYTHLLQKAWFARHPIPLDRPIDRALAEILTEGMGNYYSLSSRWRSVDGNRSPVAEATLRELEPRFVARLAALACASPAQAEALTADLSMGRFDAKWGALPMALWIESGPGDVAVVMRGLLEGGPEGIWAFAGAHLAPALVPALEEARAAVSACGGTLRRQLPSSPPAG